MVDTELRKKRKDFLEMIFKLYPEIRNSEYIGKIQGAIRKYRDSKKDLSKDERELAHFFLVNTPIFKELYPEGFKKNSIEVVKKNSTKVVKKIPIEVIKKNPIEVIEDKLRLLRQAQLRSQKIIDDTDSGEEKEILGSIHLQIIDLTLDLRSLEGTPLN